MCPAVPTRHRRMQEGYTTHSCPLVILSPSTSLRTGSAKDLPPALGEGRFFVASLLRMTRGEQGPIRSTLAPPFVILSAAKDLCSSLKASPSRDSSSLRSSE